MHFLHHYDMSKGNASDEREARVKLLSHLTYIDVVAKKGSIRKAAESLNITSTALNRRILSLEDELGAPLFERLPNGVRLNTAGELLIQHIRSSISDLSRVKSQIADLSGMRAGHVTIASGAEIVGSFLPHHIASYRSQFPHVTFEILRRAPEAAMKSLRDLTCDFALIFGAVPATDFHILLSVDLTVMVAMSPDHPLAKKSELRLSDCLTYPAILPADGSGLYDLLTTTQRQKGITLQEAITSESFEFMAHYARAEEAISFMVSFGETAHHDAYDKIILRQLHPADSIHGRLHIVQNKGRVLSVAAAKFVEQVTSHLCEVLPDNVHQ